MTAENTHDLDGIELADAVESIRNQLVEAASRATGRPLAFAVGDIQMEFTLELRKEAKAGGKVKAWVVEAGTDASRATGRTHKVAFTLSPQNAVTGEAWAIGTEDDGSTEGFGATARFGAGAGDGAGADAAGAGDGAARA
ncbi:trypco2 family protein [Streptomyces cavourensis]|uniref:trypco2 family protein n=1 Tax=Streptomyces cavourensis TaxID=67258 RepID=UPI001C93BDF2|nr:trypco2 family protein [Streptomyces cavourensis]